MKRFAFLLVVFVLTATAFADRVIVIKSSKAHVDSFLLAPAELPDGGREVAYTVCGRSEFADGGLTQQSCGSGLLVGADFKKSMQQLLNGSARQLWLKHERLE